MHADLASELASFHTVRGRRLNQKAPRGNAKTTYISKAYPIYCALEGIEPLILLLAETGPQADAYLAAVRQEIESNPKLAAAYPGRAGVGPVWQGSEIRLRNGTTIVSRGAGGRILGLTRGPIRPSLVICDDLNERRDAHSPTLRGRKWNWFRTDLLNVGSPITNYIVAGTPIHRGAVVCELEHIGEWKTRSYRSIINWPVRSDLWEQWERILSNMADPERATNARQFYDSNRSEMDRGAEVLWPDRFPLYDLMLKRAELGPNAFASEFQDQPGIDGSAEWPSEYFDHPGYWFENWPTTPLVNVAYYDSAGDPGARPGDYHALVNLQISEEGILYFDAKMWRGPNSEAVAEVDTLAREWGVQALGVETNFGGAVLLPLFDAHLERLNRNSAHKATQDYGPLPIKGVLNQLPKPTRIRRIDPYLSRKQVRVRATPGGRLLTDQWREFAGGDHDDGPDAADGCLQLARYLLQ